MDMATTRHLRRVITAAIDRLRESICLRQSRLGYGGFAFDARRRVTAPLWRLIVAATAAAAGAALFGGAALAASFPYCAISRGGDVSYTDCSYASLEACREEILGLGGFCQPNPPCLHGSIGATHRRPRSRHNGPGLIAAELPILLKTGARRGRRKAFGHRASPGGVAQAGPLGWPPRKQLVR